MYKKHSNISKGKYIAEQFAIGGLSEDDPDFEIDKLRKKMDQEDKERQIKEMRKIKEREDHKRKQETIKRKFESLKDKRYTYDFAGNVIPIQSVKTESLPRVAAQCYYAQINTEKTKVKYIPNTRATTTFTSTPTYRTTSSKTPWRNTQTGFSGAPIRAKTPQKENYVEENITHEGSNFEKIMPTFVGVSISEQGKSKKGNVGYGDLFGKHKICRSDYEARVSEVNTLSLQRTQQLLEASRPAFAYRPSGNKTAESIRMMSIEQPIPEEDLRILEESRVYGAQKDLVCTKYNPRQTIKQKENFDIHSLIDPKPYQSNKLNGIQKGKKDERSILPKEQKKFRVRIIRSMKPSLSMNHFGYGTYGTNGRIHNNRYPISDTRMNDVDRFNINLLGNQGWGTNSTLHQYQQRSKPLFMPKDLQQRKNIGTMKNLPRERRYLEKISTRLAPPPLGQTRGHGVVK